MSKLIKNYYYGKDGIKKLNCYRVSISKEVLDKTNINSDDDIEILTKNNKIIIKKCNLSK